MLIRIWAVPKTKPTHVRRLLEDPLHVEYTCHDVGVHHWMYKESPHAFHVFVYDDLPPSVKRNLGYYPTKQRDCI